MLGFLLHLLGGQDALVITQALNRAAAFIRKQLGKELEMRYLPKLIFEVQMIYLIKGKRSRNY